MKKIIVIGILGFLIGCTSLNDKTQSTDKDSINNDYQQRINRLVNGSDLPDFAGFNDLNINMASKDLATLVEADVYFNQGNYVNALPKYEKLAYQYKIPQIIYKTIICYQSLKNNPIAVTKINRLADLLITVAPNTNMANLLEVRKFLYANDISNAKASLKKLLATNNSQATDNAHDYLLFLSLLINGDGLALHSSELNQFADFVIANYSRYPEAYLLSAVIYASTNNVNYLNKTLVRIKSSTPQWKLPFILAVNILSAQKQYASIIAISKPYVIGVKNIDWTMENIYIGALVNNNQVNNALAYLKQQQADGVTSPNLELNIGLIYAYNGNYQLAIEYLRQVTKVNSLMSDLVSLYVGLLYDLSKNPALATTYYKEVHQHAFLQTVANSILLNNYAVQNNESALTSLLNQMAVNNKLSPLDSLLFKTRYYMSFNDYTSANKLLVDNYSQYKNNPDYLYTYANLLAFTKQTNQAIRAYKAYIKLAPESSLGYNDLAYVYLEQTNNYRLGFNYAKKAAQLDITDYNVRDTLGFAYYKLKDYVTAYPLIYSSYQQLPTKEGAEHLQAVLIKLNRANLAATLPSVPPQLDNNQLKALLASKILPFMMLLQYGVVNSNFSGSNGLFGV